MKNIISIPLVLAFLFGPAWLDHNLPTFDFITPLMESLGNFLHFLASNK